MGTDSATSYDAVPYESHAFHQTHPRWLATIGALFGVQAPAPSGARVLELGAAGGGNIIAIAESLPHSSCLGVDLSSRQVADGRQLIAATGLSNVELRHASILDVDASYGQFDYVICHGVYSWVDAETQRAILRLCSERLTENGIAYVSYNTYPGWHMKGMLRDMMKFHADRFKDPAKQIEQSRALLEVLSKTVPAQDNPYGLLLQREAMQLRESSDGYVFHEHLEANNAPCYFHEFARRSIEAGLQFLGESELRGMLTDQLPAGVQAALREVGTNILYAEQYMDFFRNRTFRQTLLCRKSVPLTRRLSAESIRAFSFASPLSTSEETSASAAAPARYSAENWPTATINGAFGKTTMLCLGEAWPEYLSAGELERQVRARLGLPVAERTSIDFLEMLWNWFAQGIVWTTLEPPHVVRRAGKTPRASVVARAQVASGRRLVSNLHHRLVPLSEADARLLPLLDGTGSREKIAERCGGDPTALDAGLERLAHSALLSG
ncbi:MAG TPA: class I SAM-dependent methyltransferase [Polyangiaceae bacterium]|nr:class I SAM-dependent methyltransferase [Polyangiaceae bacterium]